MRDIHYQQFVLEEYENDFYHKYLLMHLEYLIKMIYSEIPVIAKLDSST